MEEREEAKRQDPPQADSGEKADSSPKNSKGRLYDKIPVSFRQVDIFSKVMIAVLALVLLIGILTGTR